MADRAITVKATNLEMARQTAAEVLAERNLRNVKIGEGKATGAFSGRNPSIKLFRFEYSFDED